MRTFAVLAGGLLGASAAQQQQPTTPTLCTSANKGRCDCANLAPATSPVSTGSTYTWYLNGEQRCFTTYNTGSGSGSSLRPTVLYLQCYGGDKLTAITRPAIEAADRFGFALARVSPVARNFLPAQERANQAGEGLRRGAARREAECFPTRLEGLIWRASFFSTRLEGGRGARTCRRPREEEGYVFKTPS